ncbi:MAG: hypothetical protein GC165_16790 [Armatimonadetes bacterium]|nr:hypothetical protein [Armatimonadota bacterium]MBS1725214.1 hypothetical protein [Armatimonadota bacterium]
MIFKAMVVPLVLIICFGGGFVAMTKPFNLKATSIIFALALGVLAYGYTRGVFKLVAAGVILTSLFLLFSGKLKR